MLFNKYEHKYTSKSQSYMTPTNLVNPLLDFEHIKVFTTDIACSNKNIPAKKYRTEQGEFNDDLVLPLSTRDGLAGECGDGIHFCNPPWDKSKKFLEVIYRETNNNPNCKFWCVLDGSRFETIYYRDYITRNINCFWVTLPKSGFIVPESPIENPIPSVKAIWVYFGQDSEDKAIDFQDYLDDNNINGTVVYNYINAVRN